MRRRSVLLGVVLVDVINEELCDQLVGDKLVAELPGSAESEGKTEKLEVCPLKDPREESKGNSKPAVPDEILLILDVPVKVVGSTIVDRGPGSSVDVSVLFIGIPLPVIAEPGP